MKGKSKYLIILLLLLVVCSGLVTYAIYKTNKSGNATVDAARWNVVFKNGEEVISNNFDISLEDAEWTNELGRVATGKIAPGSTATFYITLDATNTETDVYYDAVVDSSFDQSDFEVTVGEDSGVISYSTTANAMIKQIPITVVWNGNINDDDNKNSDDLLKRARNITIPIKLTAAQKLFLRYTLTFNDGFGNILSTKKVMENETVGELPSNPTKVGYTFSGWYDAETGGNEVTTDTPATSGMNIYAHWTIKYIAVTFNSNGGSAVNTIQVQEGGTIANLPSSTKSESELIGWFDSNDNILTTSTQIMDNITYTAHWEMPSYSRAGTLVYYDPVSNDTCDSTHTTSSTCYQWRIIKENSNNSTIQLNHNLFQSKWQSSNKVYDGPITVLDSIVSNTSNWSRVNGLTYDYDSTINGNYNYGKLSCVNGICTVAGKTISNVVARLITKQEFNSISNKNAFFDNITCGRYSCQEYLTLSQSGSSNNIIGTIDKFRSTTSVTFYNSAYDEKFVRPVITVPKSDLNLN